MDKNIDANKMQEKTKVDAEPEKNKDSNPGVATQQTQQEMDSKRR